MDGKLYPVGIQNFEKIRRDGYCYIDKTALVYQLVKTGSYYFLSRPRRFGKSLLISTLEAYFSGKKELFEGLAMEGLEKEWKRYPILHLDLNIEKYDTPDSLDDILNRNLVAWENLYGSDPAEVSLSLRFAGVVQRACEKTGERVVILVDEYDKPMLSGTAGCIQEYIETVLRSAQVNGRIYQVRTPDRCHQVRQGERVQRPEQPHGPVPGPPLFRHLRNQRRRTSPGLLR